MFSFIPSWLPTRENQLDSRQDELARIDKEYGPTMQRMLEHQKIADERLSKLQATFTVEQLELFLAAKLEAQQASFYAGRIQYYDTRRREIPIEQFEIENDIYRKPNELPVTF